MEVSLQKLANSEVALEIKIPTDQFQKFFDRAVLDLANNMEAKGFRKGQVPKEIVEREAGQGAILKEAAELAIKEVLLEAIAEKKIEPLGQPEVEILKLAPANPFEFRVKLAVLPEVKLPDYKELAQKVEKKKVEVSSEDIERLRVEKERIEQERVRQEVLEKISRSSEMEVPQVLVEAEKKRLLENLKQQVPQMLRIKFEDYLAKIGKTEKEVLHSLVPEAERRVKNSLVLREIEKREGVEVSEEEINQEIDKILKSYPSQDIDQRKLREYTKEVIRNEKTSNLLESFIK